MLEILKMLFTLPTSPRGRKMRIDRLVKDLHIEGDAAAAVVYARDFSRGISPTDWEWEDYQRVGRRLENGEITLPIDKGEASSMRG